MRFLSALLIGLSLSGAVHAQNQGEVMKDSKPTQTLCLGRFLVDVPKDASFVANPSEYRWDKITVTRRVNPDAFRKFILDKEKKLQETKHATNPSLLKHIERSGDGNSVVMVFSESPTSKYIYETESYKWINGTQFLLKANSSRDKVPIALEMANRSLAELQSRRNGEIPTTPGFCIDGGFFAGEPGGPHHEKDYFHLRFKGRPEVMIEIYTDTNGEKVDEGLLARVDGTPIPAIFREVAKQIKMLRRGNHPVGPIQAEELLQTYPTDNHYSTHEFRWESVGKSRDIYAPTIVVNLRTGRTLDYAATPPSLSDKQAIELFDSIVNSIRVRPTGTAAEPAKPVPPPSAQSKVPLGTILATGTRCPQSGMWVCDRTNALGGERRFISEGETLPSVIVPVDRSLFAKLSGAPVNQKMATTWTLEKLPDDSHSSV